MHALARGLGWLAATAMSATAGWAALQPVLDTAVPDRIDVLSGQELHAGTTPRPSASAEPAPTISATVSSPSATPTSSPSPSRTATPPPPPDPPGGEDDDRDDEAGDEPGGSDSSPTVVDGWTATKQSDGSTKYSRKFSVEGGTAVIQIVNGQVGLVSGQASNGYEMDVDDADADRLIVYFSEPGHSYTIDAMWWQGEPYAQVSETE